VAGRLSLPVLDAGLAVAVAITIAIGVTPERGTPGEVVGDALGLVAAAVVLVRRRWPWRCGRCRWRPCSWR
jgi:hypothetical protein